MVVLSLVIFQSCVLSNAFLLLLSNLGVADVLQLLQVASASGVVIPNTVARTESEVVSFHVMGDNLDSSDVVTVIPASGSCSVATDVAQGISTGSNAIKLSFHFGVLCIRLVVECEMAVAQISSCRKEPTGVFSIDVAVLEAPWKSSFLHHQAIRLRPLTSCVSSIEGWACPWKLASTCCVEVGSFPATS